MTQDIKLSRAGEGLHGHMCLTPKADILNYYNAYLCRVRVYKIVKAWKAILGSKNYKAKGMSVKVESAYLNLLSSSIQAMSRKLAYPRVTSLNKLY